MGRGRGGGLGVEGAAQLADVCGNMEYWCTLLETGDRMRGGAGQGSLPPPSPPSSSACHTNLRLEHMPGVRPAHLLTVFLPPPHTLSRPQG